jgi:eukaryotic-like serine/threonine-protein kinase
MLGRTERKLSPDSFMNPTRWQTLSRLFAAAIEKPLAERSSFLYEACAGDPELESEVAKLLAADEKAGDFLEQPIFSAATLLPTDLTSSLVSLTSRAILLKPGDVVSDRFEIRRFIGQGGMGQVFEAFDLELRSRVAVKVIRPDISSDPHALGRFRREVQLTRLITHPNVCRTFDIDRHSYANEDGTKTDINFLTMELLDGETLADLLRRRHQLDPTEALPLILQVVEALHAAHVVGVIHRDLKPSNVLLVAANDRSRVVVTDFGLARAIAPPGEVSEAQPVASVTGSRGFMGTLAYMAPEQFERGDASVSTDIYALGLVMFEMITGQRPFFDSIPFAEAVKRLKHPAPPPKTLSPDLDPTWDTTILKCLELKPEERFSDVREVAAGLAPSGRVGGPSWAPSSHSKGSRTDPAKTVAHRASWRRLLVPFAIFSVLLSLSVLLFRNYSVKGKATLEGGSTVLLAGILNATADRRFDDAGELMRRELLQSPYFSVMDPGRIRNVLTQMTKSPDAPLDPPTAREVALRTGAPRVVFGTVSRVGDSYVLDIDIQQPDNNPSRFRAHWQNHWTWNLPQGTGENEIPSSFLAVVRDSSDWIRSQIGESANDIARVDAPPEDVTTGNWQALSEYAQAERLAAAHERDEALVALENAVRIDPNFALAYMRMGDLLCSVGRYKEGYRAYNSALNGRERGRLTRRESDRISGLAALDSSDFETAQNIFREYTVYYPNDYLGWFYRAYPLMKLERVEEAIETLEKAHRIGPSELSAPAHLARCHLILGQFPEAGYWIRKLREQGRGDDADYIEGEFAFLAGNFPEATGLFTRLRTSADPLYRTSSYSLLARAAAERGQSHRAEELLKEGLKIDVSSGDSVHQADKSLDLAFLALKREEYALCLTFAKRALVLDASPQRLIGASSVLGRAAEESPEELRRTIILQLQAMQSTDPGFGLKPISEILHSRLRGTELLARGKWNEALTEFRKASDLEAPAEDRDYLARALLLDAQHQTDPSKAILEKNEALAVYADAVARPGKIWQVALDYAPGYLADQTVSFLQISSAIHGPGEGERSRLTTFLKQHEEADKGSQDVVRAKRLEIQWFSKQ